MNATVDVLAVAPHPDDVEIFAGGTIAKLCRNGAAVAILDLTRGERASNGSPDLRRKEADAAGIALGLTKRKCLDLPDGGLIGEATLDGYGQEQLRAVITSLLRYRPRLLFLPYLHDRHPDHGAASRLLERALFFAGVATVARECGAPPLSLPEIFYYPLRYEFIPDVIVDISAVVEIKRAAVSSYKSQVKPEGTAPHTLVGSPLSEHAHAGRDSYYGSMIGVEYGEPFKIRAPLYLDDPLKYATSRPGEPLFYPPRY